jgi:predicted cation transporter
MTLAALILRDRYYSQPISAKLQYATLGALFVNISIGGTLTPFAAPPVLMVAGTWGWDIGFMIATFGWKAALAVLINALAVTLLFRRELTRLRQPSQESGAPVPHWVVLIPHHPAVFMGLFLFFLGFAHAYERFQDRLILREGLMVAFFLAGLVVLGGQQKWWLQDLLAGIDTTVLYYGATLLTAVTDNAALTYLGSLVEGVSDEFKYSLVAGAVTGGGLTVIANAPNPAGFAIVRGRFEDQSINPLGLLLAALPPTLVAILAFQLL